MARRNRTTDPHTPFAADGVRLAFGRDASDDIVHVLRVLEGGVGPYTCPGCGGGVFARAGSRRPHFAHAVAPSDGKQNPACASGQMTALHQFAQRLLVEGRTLTLPVVAAGDGEERIQRFAKHSRTFEHAASEQPVDSIRPDVVMWTGANVLHVEVYVTHACPPEKIEAVRAAGHAMLEIDLSKGERDVTQPGLGDWILHEAPRHWIYNRHLPEIEAVIADKREADRREKAAEEERLLTKAADELKAAYRRSERAALSHDPYLHPTVSRAEEGGWMHLIDGFDALAPGLFHVHPARWKSEILTSILRVHRGKSAEEVADALSSEKLVDRKLSDRTLDDYEVGKRAGLPMLAEVVEDYLKFLERSGAAHDSCDHWTLDASFHRLLEQQGAREATRASELRARDRRFVSLVESLEAIRLELLDHDAEAFEAGYLAWLESPFRGSAPVAIAEAGGPAWDELKRDLSAILKCIREGLPDPAPPNLGMPYVDEAMEKGIARRLQRVADEQDRVRRQEEQKAQGLARQAEQRVADIRKEAVDSLGSEAEKWLATYLVARRATPEELARRSERTLEHARQALRDAVALRKDMNRSGTKRGW
ncbi:hypothetical protein [Aureimonas sp. SA4125]|uniref:hypothetical protein n=1 Tax=Aureimonas sp. SA4125 TaxID=2826993 RepID=UPI001CC61FDC|nr:hypothetical protein [Aureimonas sp. SA4125]